MTNKEKFLQLVSGEDPNTIKEVKQRIKNRAMLRESQQIAIKVLMKLDHLGWSQKYLAYIMGVSPQQITKIVSGKENLTIETQIKLQTILDIPVLATYYENTIPDMDQFVITIKKQVEILVAPPIQSCNDYEATKTMEAKNCIYSQECVEVFN